MIAVLDTNVFIASRFGQASRRIVAAWEAGRFALGLSRAILREYERILGPLPFLPPDVLERWRAGFRDAEKSRLVEPAERLELSADPADNKFLEAALALKAEAIVSSDHHLLDLAGEFPVAILTPGEFLRGMKWDRGG